jgi:hypothetical protein
MRDLPLDRFGRFFLWRECVLDGSRAADLLIHRDQLPAQILNRVVKSGHFMPRQGNGKLFTFMSRTRASLRCGSDGHLYI